MRYLKFRLTRQHRFGWTITTTEAPYWLRIEYDRAMIPVAQLRNPFAGQHSWRVVLGGSLAVSWKRR